MALEVHNQRLRVVNGEGPDTALLTIAGNPRRLVVKEDVIIGLGDPEPVMILTRETLSDTMRNQLRRSDKKSFDLDKHFRRSRPTMVDSFGKLRRPSPGELSTIEPIVVALFVALKHPIEYERLPHMPHVNDYYHKGERVLKIDFQ